MYLRKLTDFFMALAISTLGLMILRYSTEQYFDAIGFLALISGQFFTLRGHLVSPLRFTKSNWTSFKPTIEDAGSIVLIVLIIFVNEELPKGFIKDLLDLWHISLSIWFFNLLVLAKKFLMPETIPVVEAKVV